MKKIKNIQIKDARGRDVYRAPDKPFRLDEALLIAIESSKTGLRLSRAASKIVAVQSTSATEIVLEDAELENVVKAVKSCTAFTDVLREQVDETLSGATEAIVEVR